MAEVRNIDRQSAVAGFSARNVMWVIIIGVVVGLIVWGGTILLKQVIIEPIFCKMTDGIDICANRQSIAYNIALVVGSVVGLVGLVRAWIYRPLLISIATAVTLWGMGETFNQLNWYVALPMMIILSVLSYFFYAWICQIRKLIIVLIITVIVVIGLRSLMYF